jgi:integrase
MFKVVPHSSGKDSDRVSTEQALCQWILEKQHEVAPATLDFYRQTAFSFLEYLGGRRTEPIDLVTRQDFVQFRGELAGRLSAKTVNHRIKTLRMVFEWAFRDHLVSENYAKQVRSVRNVDRSVRRPFTIEEIRLVLVFSDPEWQSMIRMGLYTGQRLGDIARIDWRNVDFQSGVLRLVTGKTQRRIVIPMAKQLYSYLFLRWADYVSPGFGPVHPRSKATVIRCEGRVTSLSNQFAGILAASGLRSKVSHAENGRGRSVRRGSNELSFHSLRHTAVSFLRQAGVSQAVAMELVGHDSVEISQQYTHVGLDALRSATSALPRI